MTAEEVVRSFGNRGQAGEGASESRAATKGGRQVHAGVDAAAPQGRRLGETRGETARHRVSNGHQRGVAEGGG